jgi:Zn ribbon nucleic-acid-binding protein
MYHQEVPLPDLETLLYKLKKRGFKQDDLYLHECPSCKQQSVAIFVIAGKKLGGRDIRLCVECGHTKSFRSGSGFEGREEDAGFDLRAFLG